jgi:hypothetical protein
MKKFVGGAFLALAMAGQSMAAVLITEVAPWGSDAPYGADWFELTNTGASAVDITGWKFDDSSNLAANAVPFRGITSLPAGKSAIFFESDDLGDDDQLIKDLFITNWFGGTAPAGFTIAGYGGSGLGLSGTNGDAVNIYDATNALVARVTFGAVTPGSPTRSFDNAAGLNNVAITTVSTAGVNGAFLASGAVGSPGSIVPEPATATLAIAGTLAIVAARRRGLVAS